MRLGLPANPETSNDKKTDYMAEKTQDYVDGKYLFPATFIDRESPIFIFSRG